MGRELTDLAENRRIPRTFSPCRYTITVKADIGAPVKEQDLA